MFCLEVEFLSGRYVASSHDDRTAPEWPPHPVRLIYSLVAAAGPERTAEQEEALEWLCSQAPPSISCGIARPRTPVTAYVPVNDRAGTKSASPAGTIPRSRQPREFPTMVLADPVVAFTWPEEPPAPVRQALSDLAERVSYLGHSSSPVRVAGTPTSYPPTLVPRTTGPTEPDDQLLRVPASSLVPALDAAVTRYEATGVRGALPCDYAGYFAFAPQAPATPNTVFGDGIVIRRVEGPRLPLATAERLALALRDAVLSLMSDPVPEVVSGHDDLGKPSQRPHVAFVALPDVGHPHATGSLAGIAVLLPRDLDPFVRNAIEDALARLTNLRITRTIEWSVRVADLASERLPTGLLVQTWRAESDRWATATPLELDRFIKDRLGREAEEVVADSAVNIGLPRPKAVILSQVSALPGAGHWRDIRRRSRGPHRPLVHAEIRFDQPVRGPVVLGSGRYRGLGLCRPLRSGGPS